MFCPVLLVSIDSRRKMQEQNKARCEYTTRLVRNSATINHTIEEVIHPILGGDDAKTAS